MSFQKEAVSGPFTPQELQLVRTANFRHEQSRREMGYSVHRGYSPDMKTPFPSRRNNVGEYDKALALFEDKKLSEHIEEMVMAGRIVRLLDVGCGSGRFLYEAKKKWGDNIQCYGITAKRFHSLEDIPDLYEEEVRKDIGIDIRVGNAERLAEEFPENFFDVVVSVFAVTYAADELAVLQGMYDVTKVNGIGMVDHTGLFGYVRDGRVLKKHLVDRYGFDISPDSGVVSGPLAFRKNQESLVLPVTTQEIVFDQTLGHKIMYRFNNPNRPVWF